LRRARRCSARLPWREQASARFTLANVYSAPAVAGGALIVGDQDGFVYGLQVPNARTEDRSE
jgi:hypothetical protein